MHFTATSRDPLVAQGAILRTLAYFDVFRHPLTVEEIQRFGDHTPIPAEDLLHALRALEQKGIVSRHKDHWSLMDCTTAVAQREEAETRARQRMPKALAMSRRIARFPFVRAVFLSGSMSKGSLAPDGDIDYFIITVPGRLWVARTMLVLYKKLFLLNSHRDFCVNYFLDTEHLTVEDRNRFTATEVVTLIPTYGNGTTETFFERNAWAFAMYPGMPRPRSREVSVGTARRKGALERALGGDLGDFLDGWCMNITWHYWKRKFDHLDARTFELALRTRTYVSKHHPSNFQHKVLDGYQLRVAALERKLGTTLQ
ncbi:MAG: nucleotidyltransferase domain-containing protein [Flavobacteriales bacterium]|nr:nucleotidyltransferase domain-containing protein [Flavobacteriales bacterium]